MMLLRYFRLNLSTSIVTTTLTLSIAGLGGPLASAAEAQKKGVTFELIEPHCLPGTIERDRKDKEYQVRCTTDQTGFLVALGPDACPTCASVSCQYDTDSENTVLGSTCNCKPDDKGGCGAFAAKCAEGGHQASCNDGNCECKSGTHED